MLTTQEPNAAFWQAMGERLGGDNKMSSRTLSPCLTWQDRKARAKLMIKDFCRNWPVEGLTYRKGTTLSHPGYTVIVDGVAVEFVIKNGKTVYCGERLVEENTGALAPVGQ